MLRNATKMQLCITEIIYNLHYILQLREVFLIIRDFFQKHVKIQILNGIVRCGLWYQHVCCVVKHWPLQDALKMASGWSSVLITSVHSCWPVFCWSVSRSVRQAGWSMCRLVVMIWANWFWLHQQTQEACSGIIWCWFIQVLRQQQAL